MKAKYESLYDEAQKAVVCYLIRNEEVLLVRRDIVSNNLGKGRLAGVGGKVEDDETFEVTLGREVKEEVGSVVTEYTDRGFVFFMHKHAPEKNMYVRAYVCTGWEGEPCVTDEGHVTPVWVSRDCIPFNDMFTDNELWVGKVLEGASVEAYVVYNEKGEIVEQDVRFY